MTEEGKEIIRNVVQAACEEKDTRKQILTFISENGGGCVYTLNAGYERRAAILMIECLQDDGLVSSTVTQNRQEYMLTDAGRAALRDQ